MAHAIGIHDEGIRQHQKYSTDHFLSLNILYNYDLKNTIIDKTLTYASETSTLTNRDRKQLNSFERKVYRTILGPVYDNKKKLEDIN
jgi:hypothetical protein